ncbi:hypothetical protein CO038_00085 [Candidatus Pacearchaeota archaeon CG_4_9_14_0_2_um_filter_39_13]|nr:hypothetical protein [Candidatus Pacearchaeota archaeon]OIO43572.1 MAG: hypothetical protein AUJ64_02150 [Candidatus Pacearchaeota archaeon CG1_02_39_14]PJC45137.1 MAG: hypothetical protein CO038_00085 [Candidatus Pacearchaeota archaeon CG_4_9_14_0_2_um_filter_39_13]
MIRNKRAALELSVGTIVVIVIALMFLILGTVLVRKVMCGAVDLTGDINSNVQSEINRLFGSSGGEVQCVGSGAEPVKMVPGKENVVYCTIRAPVSQRYTIDVVDYDGFDGVTRELIQRWIRTDTWTGTVAPGDEDPKKVVRLSVPDNAPEGALYLQLEAKNANNEVISTQDLDFEISRVGFFRSAIC